MPRKSSLLAEVREGIAETHRFIDVIREADRVLDETRYVDPPADEWEQFLREVGSALRNARRELGYALWIPLRLGLVVLFNLGALMLAVWLLPLILGW